MRDSLTAKLGRQSGERVVGSQTVLDTARERCVDRRLALRACVDQLDSEIETAGFDQPSCGLDQGLACPASYRVMAERDVPARFESSDRVSPVRFAPGG